MNISSNFFDKEVQLAMANGWEEVHTMTGSGYLLPSKKSIPEPKSLVAYQIIIMRNQKGNRAGASGFMVGNRGVFEKAMKTGEARLNYSPEKMLDIRIVNLEGDTANFTVQTRIGI